MSDEELTALAAKAFGNAQHGFSPLTDDGDAFRLAVKLEMDVFVRGGRWTEAVRPMCPAVKEPHNGDPCAATRRAIVRAAAEIGRRMA